MVFISKQKIQEILQNAPEGLNPSNIVSALRQRGHELEGFTERFKQSVNELPGEFVEEVAKPIGQMAQSAITAPARVATIPVDLANEALRSQGITKNPLPTLQTPLGAVEPVSQKTRRLTEERGPVAGAIGAASEAALDVAGLGSVLQGAGIGTQEITLPESRGFIDPQAKVFDGGLSEQLKAKTTLKMDMFRKEGMLDKVTTDGKTLNPDLAENMVFDVAADLGKNAEAFKASINTANTTAQEILKKASEFIEAGAVGGAGAAILPGKLEQVRQKTGITNTGEALAVSPYTQIFKQIYDFSTGKVEDEREIELFNKLFDKVNLTPQSRQAVIENVNITLTSLGSLKDDTLSGKGVLRGVVHGGLSEEQVEEQKEVITKQQKKAEAKRRRELANSIKQSNRNNFFGQLTEDALDWLLSRDSQQKREQALETGFLANELEHRREYRAQLEQAERLGLPQLKSTLSQDTMLHETLHILDDEFGIDKAAFSKIWDRLVVTDRSLSKIDDHIGGFYKPEKHIRDTERFARLGTLVLEGGINAIPPELRPFYKDIFDMEPFVPEEILPFEEAVRRRQGR